MRAAGLPTHGDATAAPPQTSLVLRIFLLWLAGNGMRMTILAVPPLIPLIHDDFHMSETEVGILAGMPVALFAAAAIGGSLLIARFGAFATVVTGLLCTALGSALRGVAPDTLALYGATVVTGFGVAIMHPSMPPLVRAWLPDRIGFGTAVYANGLLVGEILPVWLMLPVILPLVGGSWRLGFVVWALPCAVFAVVLLMFGPRAVIPPGPKIPGRWWPQWNDGLLWRIGLLLGGVNATYFTTNHFLPDYLNSLGQGHLIGPSLVALNVGQLPGSFLLLWLAGRLERHAATYVAFGVLTLVSALGIMFGSGVVVVIAAGIAGFAAASVLILVLALPPLLCAAPDVPRMAAGIFTISYSCAVIIPICCGLVWDMTGVPAAAFVPICIGALAIIVLAPTLGLSRRIAAMA